MYEIVNKTPLAPEVVLFEVRAPEVASSVLPGQFVVLRLDEKGERFPLTVMDHDEAAGTIFLVVQATGLTTKKMIQFDPGDCISDLLGPLGEPTDIKKFGRVACVAGGVGIAMIYPVADALKKAGNRLTAFIGARSAEYLILEEKLDSVADELVITTDDGSRGIEGNVARALNERLEDGEDFDRAFAVGPVPMMQAVADVTRSEEIKTIVSLNPIMVDGTGMCGGCRVTVADEVKFACIDGPEFDGHKVDFEELQARRTFFDSDEDCRLEEIES